MSKRHNRLKRQRYYLSLGMFHHVLPEMFESIDVCWCGAKNPHYSEIHHGCGGMGVIDCRCGGDLCVCHNHGEVECIGCPECRIDDDDEYDQEFYDDQDHHPEIPMRL